PALSYLAPLFYDDLSDEEKQNIAELSDDFCIIHNADQTDRFIRGTLTQKVIDHCENLEYGLWVSLSEKSFEDYKSNFGNKDHEGGYFGWLSNNLPGFQFQSIPTNVITRKGGLRPDIIPHKDFDHPFVRDYYNGITKEEAERRILAAFNKT
ncbi:MAG: DUF2199 domain-containing protein, partial [Bacteroidetes bacterium]|nr:DUF2199 domain-containing protein [Bacteroidota bacterium]